MSRFSIDLTAVKEELPLIPVGIYPARIVKGEVNSGTSNDREWANFAITLTVDDPELAASLEVDEVTAYFRGMFSFDPEDGHFQPNRCPEFGNFLKVLGYTNEQDFQTQETDDAETELEYILALAKAAFESAIGTEVMVTIEHRPYSKTNKKLISCVGKLIPVH